MQWTGLSPIAIEPYFSRGFQQELEEANQRISVMLENRQKFDEKLAEIKSQAVEEVDYDNLVTLPGMQAWLLKILPEELKLRRELAGLFDKMIEQYGKGAEKAYAAHEKAQSEVRAALVSMGYVDEEPSSQIIGTIQPGWIMAHPIVREKQEELRSRKAISGDRGRQQQNEKALQDVENRLGKVRDRATAI